jgi:hypothetical protein
MTWQEAGRYPTLNQLAICTVKDVVSAGKSLGYKQFVSQNLLFRYSLLMRNRG